MRNPEVKQPANHGSHEAQDLNSRPPAREDDHRRGGIQGGLSDKMLNTPDLAPEGTPDINAAGRSHLERPGVAVPNTGLAARPVEGVARLQGGKSPESLRAALHGATFPTKKDVLVHVARRNNGPTDVIGALEGLPRTDYASFDELLRDFPRLPEEM